MFKKIRLLAVIALFPLLALTLRASAATPSAYYEVETFPKKISANCRGGIAKVYDECSDQLAILKQAIKRAKQTGKSVLLVYGAEWCIWCHVFDKYVNGQSRAFNYEWEYEGQIQNWNMKERSNPNAEKEARILNKYVAENFVVAHIESYYSPNGKEVIEYIGFDNSKITFVPYIFSLNRSGKYAAYMLASDAIPGLEIRTDSGEDYRGFDRKLLLAELVKLREKSK